MKFNGHSSSFKLGTTPVVTLNDWFKIVMKWKDKFGSSSLSLHVSELIFSQLSKKTESRYSCFQIPQEVMLNDISTLWTTEDYFQETK